MSWKVGPAREPLTALLYHSDLDAKIVWAPLGETYGVYAALHCCFALEGWPGEPVVCDGCGEVVADFTNLCGTQGLLAHFASDHIDPLQAELKAADLIESLDRLQSHFIEWTDRPAGTVVRWDSVVRDWALAER